jgi:hypothetical protein
MMLIPLFDYDRYRIIMESPFIFKGKDYLYFPDGCKFYSLYRTTRKINSFSELEYIGEKFFHLNPSFDIEVAKKLFIRLSERDSGHIIRTYGDSRVENMIERVSERKKVPYCGRLRKIIFNPSKMIEKSVKMKIVGSIIGTKQRPTSTQIDEVVEELWLDQQKITYTKIANKLNTSRYLISWYFSDDVNASIKNANEEIKQTNLISKAVEAIDILTDKGDKLKMRELKKLTSIRNYSLLKKAVTVYLNGL